MPVHRGPSVAAVAHVARSSLLSGDLEETRGEAGAIADAMDHRREADHRGPDAPRSQRQHRIFRRAAETPGGVGIVRIILRGEPARRHRHGPESRDQGAVGPRERLAERLDRTPVRSDAAPRNLETIPPGLPPNSTRRNVERLICLGS